MNHSDTREEPGYGAWIVFWAVLFLLTACVIAGAVFASQDEARGDYACGIVLCLAAIALAFLWIKNRFDAGPADWRCFLLVDDMANLVAVIVVFTVLALAGLFVAAGYEFGGLHNGGVALFLTSGLAVFLSLKHVFDNLDRRH